MTKHLLGFALLAVFTTATVHAQQDALKDFVYEEFQMGFSMPGDPVAGTQTVDSALGKIVIHSFILDKGDSAMMVMVNVYPDAVLKANPAKLLAAGRDGAVGNIKAKVTSQKKIKINNYPGLEFDFKSAKYHGTYRIYLVGTSLYQLGSLSTLGTPLIPGTDQFMASFHLLKP